MTIRIATRGSALALAQAEQIAGLIRARLGEPTETVVVQTTGDRIQSVSLAKLGGKGLFVKEVEEALLDGRADVAVHSAKDLPATLAPGLRLAAFPVRADPRDALVLREAGASLAELPEGARVGTGSTRRTAQLRALRPDLRIEPLRGNVPTRLRKLTEAGLDAVVLAAAGLDRLGLADRIAERIAPDVMLPAIGQGTLALETRDEDAERIAALDAADVAPTAEAERAFLTGIGGDCTTPLAGFATLAGEALHFTGLLCSTDGKRCVRAEERVARHAAAEAGDRAARRILADGGRALLEELRESDA